jgi:hypothetical protein
MEGDRSSWDTAAGRTAANGPPRWPTGWKLVVSGLVLLHCMAVFVPPFAFACTVGGSSSPFADAWMAWLRPYVSLLYLDHGYFFFAPNPGPSHLVQYRLEFEDGRPPVTGRFPDLARERPRLLYHRHFMLAEALHSRFVPPQPPPEPSPPPLTASPLERGRHTLAQESYQAALREWRFRRRQYEAMRDSIAAHLRSVSGADRVILTRIEHRLALPDEVEKLGLRLDAPELYSELSENPPGGIAP